MGSESFSDEVSNTCRQIGQNLLALRVNRLNETQETMAARIGVSRKTYIRMEKGDPTVKIGYWLEAAMIARSLDQWKPLFSNSESLFSQRDAIKFLRKRVRK
jgi:DNA-binding XRE family transcriptional regulator